ncbi:MAG: glutamine synthetase family protein [Gammaproteobacteria bacterium]|jgi:glutamine synthetase|nr:glutamine synthetase family protein [Gammaproteobacteria bacterium]
MNETEQSRSGSYYSAQEILNRYPEIKTAELLICDTNGVLRGKRADIQTVDKVMESGMNLPLSVFALDISGETVEETGLGMDSGDADGICRVVPGSLTVVPWRSPPRAQLQLTMTNMDGTPFYGDPRSVLNRVLERFRADGLKPVIALEMEFYLLDRDRDAQGKPQPLFSPVTGERLSCSQVYSIVELEDYAPFLAEIGRASTAQGIPSEGAVKEYAPGQFEINLAHTDDPMLGCDQTVMLKRLIRDVASRRHNYTATFMPKPYPQHSGNGMHIHVSVLDQDGNNIFYCDNDPEQQPKLRQAVAGLAETMAESMLIFAPNANSYRRFREGSYAPTNTAWGYNNRTTGLRVPATLGDASRIEHRLAGADTNPYLLAAAVLAGIHHGITNQLEPEPITEGNAYKLVKSNLPLTWGEAMKAFAAAKVLPGYLGEAFVKMFHDIKHQEHKQFNAEVTALEYEWYLRNV